MRSMLLVMSLMVFSLFSVASFSSPANEEGKEIFELTCKNCHAPKSAGHAASLDGKHEKRKAPPMAMVKKRYLKAYPEREDFVAAVATWAGAPSKEKSLLKHALKHHGVMPAQNFEEGSLKKVAAYIYDADMGKAGCGMHGKKDGMKSGDKSGSDSCCESGKKGHGGGHGEDKKKGSCSH
ncbi:MAG: c-type cytochrome [Pseudomonadales bacterium]|nr:c-type cytochrome [Pseudomonadales bacterium]